jgi:hypothetical protein
MRRGDEQTQPLLAPLARGVLWSRLPDHIGGMSAEGHPLEDLAGGGVVAHQFAARPACHQKLIPVRVQQDPVRHLRGSDPLFHFATGEIDNGDRVAGNVRGIEQLSVPRERDISDKHTVGRGRAWADGNRARKLQFPPGDANLVDGSGRAASDVSNVFPHS